MPKEREGENITNTESSSNSKIHSHKMTNMDVNDTKMKSDIKLPTLPFDPVRFADFIDKLTKRLLINLYIIYDHFKTPEAFLELDHNYRTLKDILVIIESCGVLQALKHGGYSRFTCFEDLIRIKKKQLTSWLMCPEENYEDDLYLLVGRPEAIKYHFEQILPLIPEELRSDRLDKVHFMFLGLGLGVDLSLYKHLFLWSEVYDIFLREDKLRHMIEKKLKEVRKKQNY